jgi:hypothetical protein
MVFGGMAGLVDTKGGFCRPYRGLSSGCAIRGLSPPANLGLAFQANLSTGLPSGLNDRG